MNNDLISRSELKKAIKAQQVIDREINPNIATISYHNLNNIVDNAPTVPIPDFKEGYKQAILDGKLNFERPQGKWIEGFHDYFETLDCSCCGYVNDERHLTLNFCPNCGADMRGGAE